MQSQEKKQNDRYSHQKLQKKNMGLFVKDLL